MSTQQRVTWAAAVGAIVAALTLGVFVARAVAREEIAPLKERITAVETDQKSSTKRIDEMAGDVRTIRDCLLSGVCRKPTP